MTGSTTRTPVGTAAADALITAYARTHRQTLPDTLELAAAHGIEVRTGTLMLIGARWYLLERPEQARQFRVQLGRRSHTVTAATRARLVRNLIDLGLQDIQAGRHGYRAWSKGHSHGSGRFAMQEVRGE